MSDTGRGPARVRVTRSLDWMDTDAAGIWHWSAAFRHLESAEHELHRRLGIVEHTFGFAPRVRIEVDFSAPVRFGEDVTTELGVESVGRSSIAYSFDLAVGERPVAAGSLVTVIIDGDGRPTPVPDVVREPLLGAGDVTG